MIPLFRKFTDTKHIDAIKNVCKAVFLQETLWAVPFKIIGRGAGEIGSGHCDEGGG